MILMYDAFHVKGNFFKKSGRHKYLNKKTIWIILHVAFYVSLSIMHGA